ncbi:hypothetical protein D3C84_703690 [compost metagenome]
MVVQDAGQASDACNVELSTRVGIQRFNHNFDAVLVVRLPNFAFKQKIAIFIQDGEMAIFATDQRQFRVQQGARQIELVDLQHFSAPGVAAHAEHRARNFTRRCWLELASNKFADNRETFGFGGNVKLQVVDSFTDNGP